MPKLAREPGPPPLTRWNRFVHHWQASILPDIAPEVAVYTLVAFGVCIVHTRGIILSPPSSFFNAVSIVVAFLLVFRTNTAYDRFWEGRRLWTSMTVSVRNISRIVAIDIKDFDADKGWVLGILIDILVAIRDYLRTESRDGKKYAQNALGRFYLNPRSRNNPETIITVDTMDDTQHRLPTHTLRPLILLADLHAWVHNQRKLQHIDPVQQQILYNQIANLADYYGQCQRIVKTPIPPAYQIHLKHITFLFCIM